MKFPAALGAAVAVLFSAMPARAQAPNIEKADLIRFIASTKDELRPYFSNLVNEGERNAVLNFNRLALAAMEIGDVATASLALDRAIERIETIYANDPNAERARSLWNAESAKDFKGEPYERAMTYYYRGVLYVHQGDYQNARAAFLGADRQTAIAASEQYEPTFALMNWLGAWASFCDGDTVRADELHRIAIKQDASFANVPYKSKFAYLIDAGIGPTKKATGAHKEVLEIAKADVGTPEITFESSKAIGAMTSFGPLPLGSLTLQATTRGGRPIQGILDGKAQFKNVAGSIGDASLLVGQVALQQAILDNNKSLAQFGLFGSLLGAVVKSVASAAKPAADVREWDGLPDKLIVFGSSDALSPDQLHNALRASDKPNSTANPALYSSSKNCAVAWTRIGPSMKESLPNGSNGTIDMMLPVEPRDLGLVASVLNDFGAKGERTAGRSN